MSLKERLQVTARAAPNEDDGNEWVWGPDVFGSRRPSKMSVPPTSRKSTTLLNEPEMTNPMFNQIPALDISNVRAERHYQMPLVVAGSTDVSGEQAELKYQATTSRGACVHELSMMDDQYTGEHVDLFYGVAFGEDGDPDGFVERNNYLDRL